MKRKFLLASVLTGAVALVASMAIIANPATDSFAKGFDENHDHTVNFVKSDISHETYVPAESTMIIGASQENAIVVSETEKYDISSVSSKSYYYGEQSDINFDAASCLFELNGNNNFFYLYFQIKWWADVDLQKSIILYEQSNLSEDQTTYLKWDEYTDAPDKDSFMYYFFLDTFSCFGETVKVKQIKLVFSC